MKNSKTPALLLIASIALGTALRAEVIEQVLVKVNGEIFTKTDLENRQVDALRGMGQQIDPKDRKNLGDAQLKKMLDQVTPQLLVGVVDEMLLLQRGKDLGYTLTDEQFKSVSDSIKKDNNITTDEQFQAALTQENLTMAEFRKNIERRVIMDRVQQNEVMSKIGISDEEARRYYDAHLSEFTKPQEVTLREILVGVPASGNAVNVAADEAARAKIDGLRARALSGDSFEKLAADFSDGPSAANAGLIGPLKTNDISEDLRKLLLQMKVGDITTPLRAPAGYQLLKLESRTDSEVTPFEQARDQIGDKVFTGKRQEEYEKYLDKLRSQAIIEWKNEEIKKAYEKGLADIKAGVAPVQ
jgi:peptidyl-prolyl cis-trans isomerase SurA